MEKSTVREICKERLDVWMKILVENHATPFTLIGIGHGSQSGQIQICTCEGIGDCAIAEILRAAADKLEP